MKSFQWFTVLLFIVALFIGGCAKNPSALLYKNEKSAKKPIFQELDNNEEEENVEPLFVIYEEKIDFKKDEKATIPTKCRKIDINKVQP